MNRTWWTTRVSSAAFILIALGCGGEKTTEPQLTVDRVSIDRTSAVLATSGHVQLVATAKTKDGQDVPNVSVTWSSNSPAATVSADGTVTGVAPGRASITATVSGKRAQVLVAIVNATPGALGISPSQPTLALGQVIEARAIAFDADGLGTVVTGATLTSSNASVLSANGPRLTATGSGEATITATSNGQTASATARVVVFGSIAPMGRSEGAGEFTSPDIEPADTLSETAICAVTTGGDLYCAGQRYGPMAVRVAASQQFRNVVSGGWGGCSTATRRDGLHHCPTSGSFCALNTDGAPYCWTLDDPAAVPTTLRFSSISPAEADSAQPPSGCALTAAGKAYCWGKGGGRIGNGSFQPSPTPVAVSSSQTFVEIVTNQESTCARTAGGRIFCWGRKLVAQKLDSSAAPAAVQTSLTFSKLMRGGCSSVDMGSTLCAFSACGIASGTHDVYCWGPGDSPGKVATDLLLTAVAPVAGPGFSAGMCGVTTSGALACWGVSYWGTDQFGVASTSLPICNLYPCYSQPTVTIADAHFTNIVGSSGNLCAIDASNRAVCWGPNVAGQLTDATVKLATPRPTVFSIDPGT